MNTKPLITILENALQQNVLVRVKILPDRQGNLKYIQIKPTLIKSKLHLSFTYRNATNDVVKNYILAEAFVQKINNIHVYKQVYVFTTQADFIAEITNNEIHIKQQKPTFIKTTDLKHNTPKKYPISEQAPYLRLLQVTGQNNQVLSNAYNKFKQINQYISLLQPLFTQTGNQPIHIADMGCGKGYLTFALYDYLQGVGYNPHITGIELRDTLVEQCNQYAVQCNYTNLTFKQGSIVNATLTNTQMLIALHACDTATDEALFTGIKNKCQHIVVAPCCHKQIRQNMHQNDAVLKYITSYGIYKERMAETITDVLRMLYLNACGYATKAVEFVSDAHTPKNVMIIASKNIEAKHNVNDLIAETKNMYGISSHALEEMLTANNLLEI